MIHQEVVRKSLKVTDKSMRRFDLNMVNGHVPIIVIREIIRDAYMQGVKDADKEYERRVLNA